MSTMIPSFTCAVVRPIQKEYRVRSCFVVRAQRLGDEGRPSNLVDSNLKTLKDRIEVIRMKERMSRPYGWNYDSNYISSHKKQPEYAKIIAMICGPSCLSLLIGTTLIYIFSVIAHLNM